MELALYAIAKFVAYSFWGSVGFRLHDVRDSLFRRSVRFGGVRWLLGLGMGILVFIFAGSINQGQVLGYYLAIYIPLRIVEWSVMAVLFFSSWKQKMHSSRFYLWVAFGITLSFLTDLVSPDMMNGGRFCVGRCLC